ncbi:MAG: hypothetical protein HYY18_01730 [Planctomycetes bacterium]|nr:hypothetical protein [Planctomycetota bacterium]
MKRLLPAAAAFLAAALPASARDLVANEPDGTKEESTARIAPGDALSGSFEKDRDVEWFAVACEAETVCTLAATLSPGWKARLQVVLAPQELTVSHEAPRIEHLRLPAGVTWFHLTGYGSAPQTSWSLTLRADPAPPGADVEPNDAPATAAPLSPGRPNAGQVSGTWADEDWYRFDVTEPGPWRVTLRRPLLPDGTHVDFYVQIHDGKRGERLLYSYEATLAVETWVFYPVLARGPAWFRAVFRGVRPGSKYEFTLAPFEGPATQAERAAARAAIGRGVAWLLQKGAKDGKSSHPVAAESLVLAALVEGEGRESRAEFADREFVQWLAAAMKPREGGAWAGHDVSAPHDQTYLVAIATLALAEAASSDHKPAAELCRRCLEWLLAAQLTERRPAAWKPVERTNNHHGGWRYSPKEETADISVTGWGLVALAACDAAGVEAPGMREAVDDALAFVKRCGDHGGFRYQPRGIGNNGIRNAIGALVGLLYGMEGPYVGTAFDEIDRHLFAATQVDDAEDYAMYYAYYATRACFLRGGPGWESWRSVMIRQLLRIQKPDGSWPAFHEESAPGPRYATALAVMILRLCLDEAPRYLKKEVRGF